MFMKRGATFLSALMILGYSGATWAVSPVVRELEQAFIDVSTKVRPSVVEISSEGKLSGRPGMGDLFRNFGLPHPELGPEGDKNRAPQRRPVSTGSGFIFDTLGHIITNNHVVEDATKLTVQLWDGVELEAVVVGTDPSADIAVIKIDPQGLDLRPLTLGDSDKLRVGQFAIAIGSPRGQTGSLSFGHLSALGREQLVLPGELRFQHFIQTDAAINLGNSGGPLCNIEGEVIGVNIAIVFGANSIGFAIPVNRVKKIVPQLIDSGKVVRGWLGVSIQDVPMAAARENQEVTDFLDAYSLPDEAGAFVQAVTADGPAEKSGLISEDVIRKIDGDEITDTTDLINMISDIPPGAEAVLDVWRDGKAIEVTVLIGEFPGMTAARYGRDYLGIHVTPFTEDMAARMRLENAPSSFIVAEVIEDSPADKAGIERGHFILEVAHKAVRDIDAFKKLLKENAKPGKTVLFRVKTVKGQLEKKFLKVPEDFSLN